VIFPAIAQLLQDRRLRPSDFRVYGFALERLDLGEFRPLKARTVADAVRMRRSHASRSLRRLTSLGYLDAHDKLDGHTRQYRLRMSVREPARLSVA
jgi:hypothetical protein